MLFVKEFKLKFKATKDKEEDGIHVNFSAEGTSTGSDLITIAYGFGVNLNDYMKDAGVDEEELEELKDDMIELFSHALKKGDV